MQAEWHIRFDSQGCPEIFVSDGDGEAIFTGSTAHEKLFYPAHSKPVPVPAEVRAAYIKCWAKWEVTFEMLKHETGRGWTDPRNEALRREAQGGR